MTQTGPHFKPLRRRVIPATLAALAWAGAAAAIPPPPPQALFLDCARQVYATESFICQDPALVARDAALRKLYVQAAARPGGDRAALEADQRTWTAERNRCAFDSDQRRCVEAAYAGREAVLAADDGSSAPPLRSSGNEGAPMTPSGQNRDDAARSRDEHMKPGRPPRPATEPKGAEGSARNSKTLTDPATGEPRPGAPKPN